MAADVPFAGVTAPPTPQQSGRYQSPHNRAAAHAGGGHPHSALFTPPSALITPPRAKPASLLPPNTAAAAAAAGSNSRLVGTPAAAGGGANEKPFDDLICPITHCIFTDPVICAVSRPWLFHRQPAIIMLLCNSQMALASCHSQLQTPSVGGTPATRAAVGCCLAATEQAAISWLCSIIFNLQRQLSIFVTTMQDGFSYERSAIATWLQRSELSPMTNQRLEHKGLVPNRALRNLIAAHEMLKR